MTTEDGYILTTFRVKGKKDAETPYAPSKASVIFNHGLYGEAWNWPAMFEGTRPPMFMLADQGYDIWMTNNRGTGPSLQHTSLDATKDTKYWEFSWAEMGLYDDKANIKLVKEKSGKDKVIWVGWSQGTTQLLYGLAKEKQTSDTFFADSLSRAVLLTPCTVTNTLGYDWYVNGMFKYQQMGVYNIYGPNWESHKEKLCAELDEEHCFEAINLPIPKGYICMELGLDEAACEHVPDFPWSSAAV